MLQDQFVEVLPVHPNKFEDEISCLEGCILKLKALDIIAISACQAIDTEEGRFKSSFGGKFEPWDDVSLDQNVLSALVVDLFHHGRVNPLVAQEVYFFNVDIFFAVCL